MYFIFVLVLYILGLYFVLNILGQISQPHITTVDSTLKIFRLRRAPTTPIIYCGSKTGSYEIFM